MLEDLLHDRPHLPPPLDAPARWLDTPEGRICFYDKGEGPSTILLHGVNAAATAYEMRPLFERLARYRRVVAFDWLGFGLSARLERRYDADLYKAILRFLLERLTLEGADVVALSLSCQYAAVVETEEPRTFRRLVFISPTGFGRFARRRTFADKTAAATLRLPGMGTAIFDGLTSRRAIKRYLGSMFADAGRVPPDFEWYAWATSRQHNARSAPMSFLAGLLEDVAAPTAYTELSRPTMLVFGDRARFSDSGAGATLALLNPALTVETIEDAGDLPHFEKPEATETVIRDFLRG
jgi:pimeloyl-ACP methyl ester carboxylesterase